MSHMATDTQTRTATPDLPGRRGRQAAPGWWIIPMALAGTAIWARLILWLF